MRTLENRDKENGDRRLDSNFFFVSLAAAIRRVHQITIELPTNKSLSGLAVRLNDTYSRTASQVQRPIHFFFFSHNKKDIVRSNKRYLYVDYLHTFQICARHGRYDLHQSLMTNEILMINDSTKTPEAYGRNRRDDMAHIFPHYPKRSQYPTASSLVGPPREMKASLTLIPRRSGVMSLH